MLPETARIRIAALAALLTAAALAGAASPSRGAELDRLLAAYPAHLDRIDGNWLIWKDGSRSEIDDGRGPKAFEDWLNHPDIEDMFALTYPAAAPAAAPAVNADPGRARNAPFFDKVYGDCRKGEVARDLVDVVWLPMKSGQRLKVTRVNGVAEQLKLVSAELDSLPARFDAFLAPSAGTYNCRAIAGTERVSAHGYGIAIDIATRHAHYWRWSKAGADGALPYRNEVPPEIVDAFERHGFIWGGRWYHYDTMHFEYRPELLAPANTGR